MFTLQNMITQFNTPMVDNSVAVDAQIKREKKILQEFQVCPGDKSKILQHYNEINMTQLKELTTDEFYNTNVMNTMSCISNSLTTISPEWQIYITSQLTHLKKIGAESANGIAMLSNLSNNNPRINENNADSIFVIKAGKNSNHYNDIIHEAAIAMTTLNMLRNEIPNFAFVYGYFKCGAPVPDNTGNVLSWCNSDSPVGYIIYENITNSKSMGDLVSDNALNAQQFLNYFLQFLLALKTAHDFCDFTHYDCHQDNVLIKKLPQESVIRYRDLTNQLNPIYLKTDAVVTFIDYGYSYVQTTKGEKFGVTGNMEIVSTFRDKSFIMHDVFKFLMATLDCMDIGLRDTLTPILTYFIDLPNTSEYSNFYKALKYYYFSPVYNEITSKFNITDFIQYVMDVMQVNGYTIPIVNITDQDVILNCDYANCTLKKDIFSDILNINEEQIVPSINISTFTEVLESLNQSQKQAYIIDFIKNYDQHNSLYDKCVRATLLKTNILEQFLDNQPVYPKTDSMNTVIDTDDNIILYNRSLKNYRNIIHNLRNLLVIYNNVLTSDDVLVNKMPFLEDKLYNYITFADDLFNYLQDKQITLGIDRDVNAINLDRIDRMLKSF